LARLLDGGQTAQRARATHDDRPLRVQQLRAAARSAARGDLATRDAARRTAGDGVRPRRAHLHDLLELVDRVVAQTDLADELACLLRGHDVLGTGLRDPELTSPGGRRAAARSQRRRRADGAAGRRGQAAHVGPRGAGPPRGARGLDAGDRRMSASHDDELPHGVADEVVRAGLLDLLPELLQRHAVGPSRLVNPRRIAVLAVARPHSGAPHVCTGPGAGDDHCVVANACRAGAPGAGAARLTGDDLAAGGALLHVDATARVIRRDGPGPGGVARVTRVGHRLERRSVAHDRRLLARRRRARLFRLDRLTIRRMLVEPRAAGRIARRDAGARIRVARVAGVRA
jgi:hypothetical protein